ncbi:MAG: radical SAM protein [Firmicutes bacterium]|nr:radical SAM protein [Bacillota bacterium]
MRKILFVRPNVNIDIADFSGFSFAEPLDLGWLAAYAKAEGIDCDIIDMLVDKRRDIVKLLKSGEYDVLVFTGHVTAAASINEMVKNVREFDKDIVIVVTGVMASVNPLVYDGIGIDAIIKTDPYDTFTQILQKIKAGDKNFLSLNGVYDKNNPDYEFVHYVPKHFPLREKIVKYSKHYRHSYLGPCVSIKTSYGCPNNCNFCLFAKSSFGKYWERDLDDVFAELRAIKEKDIMILDDNFTANIRRLEAFCDGLTEHGIKKTFFMLATARAIALNPDVIRKFAKNGLKYVFLGIESFDDKGLSELNKKATPEQNHEALRLLQELGVEVNVGIICLPSFKQEDFDSLISNLKKYNPIFPMINVLTPMPGTPMHETYKDKGLVAKKKYEVFNMMELIIEPEYMSKGQFYSNILKVYSATVGNKTTLNYIKEKYGKIELLRHRQISKKVLKKFRKLKTQK